MKNFLHLSALAFLMIGFTGCDDDSEKIAQPSRIDFDEEVSNFNEADVKNTISLTFTRPTAEASTITIQVASNDLAKFTFSPAAQGGLLVLEIAKGASSASFDVMPINNTTLDGNKTITFTITEMTGSLTTGQKLEQVVSWIDDESPASVTFASAVSSVKESEQTGKIITLNFSHAVPGEGTVVLALNENAGYGTAFTTEPAFTNNTLELSIAQGATSVSFKVLPTNNELFNVARDVNFTAEARGAVAPGAGKTHRLTITDDEMSGMAKGYSTNWSTWHVGKTFHYAEDGKIASVEWTQGTLSWTDTYHYSSTGELEKIVKSTGREILYIRENGRIVKEEERANNVLKKYSLFGYDDAGNIGEVAIYHLQPDGTFSHSQHFLYFYYTNGNVYKKQAYHPIGDNPDDYVLLTEDTYESYYDDVNLFGIEIIPGQSIQPNLPAAYTHK
ncbi:MAG TPA: hypothetical protein VGK39_07765, partial [Cyclobacteriaceae bacterium]